MDTSTAYSFPLIWTEPAPPPRQRALGREEIVAAAIGLADEAGIDALTMKAVAARLGPYSPMALYRYVRNKEGLVDLMLDAAAAEIALPQAPGDHWRADLEAVATGTWRMTRRHPWYALLVHTRPPAGPRQMRRVELVLGVLTRQGATVAEAMTYSALIDRYVYGSAIQDAEEARFNRRYGLDDGAKLYAAMAAVRDLAAADGSLPLLAGWLAQPSGPTTDEQFQLGLDFLLDGIAGRLAGSG
jgi:AcrR family transcriptional regulator